MSSTTVVKTSGQYRHVIHRAAIFRFISLEAEFFAHSKGACYMIFILFFDKILLLSFHYLGRYVPLTTLLDIQRERKKNEYNHHKKFRTEATERYTPEKKN